MLTVIGLQKEFRMADFLSPTENTNYIEVLTAIRTMFAELAKMDYSSVDNIPADVVRFNKTSKVFEVFNGTDWVSLGVGIAAVEGLQSALNSKLNSNQFTSANILQLLLPVDGSGSELDADKLDGKDSTDFCSSDDERLSDSRRCDNSFDDPAIARAALSLAALALKSTINNGDWSGEDLGVINGGTGASTASAARNNLSVDSSSEVDSKVATRIPISEKGAANGVAELDSSGHVSSSQLPSYVDDVLEYSSLASFPGTGESGKIYIAEDTNKSYRWGGSSYVVIAGDIALGETSSTAYRGDRGKVAYDHSQESGNPHNMQPSEIPTDAMHRTVTDAQINAWNNSTSFTPENAGVVGQVVKKTATGYSWQDGYSHPSEHPASMITEEPSRRFTSDDERLMLRSAFMRKRALGAFSSAALPQTIVNFDNGATIRRNSNITDGTWYYFADNLDHLFRVDVSQTNGSTLDYIDMGGVILQIALLGKYIYALVTGKISAVDLDTFNIEPSISYDLSSFPSWKTNLITYSKYIFVLISVGCIVRIDTESGIVDSLDFSSSVSSGALMNMACDGTYIYAAPGWIYGYGTGDTIYRIRISDLSLQGSVSTGNSSLGGAYSIVPFDGRYLYFCPYYNDVSPNYNIVRLDTYNFSASGIVLLNIQSALGNNNYVYENIILNNYLYFTSNTRKLYRCDLIDFSYVESVDYGSYSNSYQDIAGLCTDCRFLYFTTRGSIDNLAYPVKANRLPVLTGK